MCLITLRSEFRAVQGKDNTSNEDQNDQFRADQDISRPNEIQASTVCVVRRTQKPKPKRPPKLESPIQTGPAFAQIKPTLSQI